MTYGLRTTIDFVFDNLGRLPTDDLIALFEPYKTELKAIINASPATEADIRGMVSSLEEMA